MLEKHKNSTFNNAVGLTLCLMIGVFSLTKAPVAVAHQSAWSDEKMTFNFHEIPLSALARMIFGFAEQEVVGLEPLNSTLVTVAVDSVTPLNAISILLKCHGYVMEFDTDHYRVKQLGEVGAAMGRAKECINTGFGDKLAKDSEAFQPSDDANIIQPARLLVTFDNGAGKMSYLKETNQLSFEVKELALNEFIATVFNWADKDVVGLAQLDKFKLTMKQENTQAYQVASNVLNCYGFSIEQKQDHYRLLVNQGQTINASESQLCINAFAK